MKSDRLFHLKPFSLSHHKSTMRVGTDAILLGLNAGNSKTKKTLEIGTGSGIISLLIASRINTKIDAIDIDISSVEEAKENFNNSLFHHRINAMYSDFNEFAKTATGKYDLIVTNPPFFINDFRPDKQKKRTTRHSDLLSYAQICEGSISLLHPDGILCLVLPYNESKIFLDIALERGLNLQEQQLIFPGRGLQPNRVNLQLGFEKKNTIRTKKFILREENGSFTLQYIKYLKDYYIALK